MGSAASEPPWERHAADLARLVFSAVVALVLIGITALAPDTVTAVSSDIVALVENLPLGLRQFLVGVVQLLAVVVPLVVLAGLAWRRRWRLLGLIVLAGGLAALVTAGLTAWRSDSVPRAALAYQRIDSWFTGGAFPSSAYLAAVSAVLIAGSRWMRRPWRRAGWTALGLVVLARILTATEVPLHLGLVLAVGSAVGSIALLILGAPSRSTDEATVHDALARGGIEVTHLEPLAAARGELEFASTMSDGGDVLVQVIGRDERDADLMLRTWRAVSVKGLGDTRPSTSPRRAAEHEALALALARSAGVDAPAPIGVAFTEEGAAVLVEERVDGARLVDLDAADIDDQVLAEVWREVDLLQQRRIAHRDLDARHLVRHANGVSINSFGRAALDASDELLAADVANLFVSLALVVDERRAASAAVEAIGAERFAAALPMVQQAVLTAAVRAQLRSRKGFLDQARAEAGRAVGIETVEVAKLKRITLKGIVSLVGGLVLGSYALTVVSNWGDIWTALTDAHLSSLLWLALFSFLAFVGGAISLMGAVTVDLSFLRTLQVNYAQSFLNRFTPANAGGMAMRTRYLQLEGCDLTTAAAAVGMTSVVSGVVQVMLIVLFLVWGNSTSELRHFTSGGDFGLLTVVVVVAAIVGAVLLSGWGRRVVVPVVRRTLGKAVSSIRELFRSPRLLGRLFGGALLAKAAIVFAFAASVDAFGVDLSFAHIGAMYMLANTIGSAVPTPGGVGGIEAALTAVLLSADVEGATAAAIVLLFRFMTFWLPTLPGYVMLRRVQRTGIV